MNILWITNKPLREAVSAINGNLQGKVTESWVAALAEAIRSNDNLTLSVAATVKGIKKLTIIHGEIATHYLIPEENGAYGYHRKYEQYWKEIKDIATPNIIHIHGTERPLGLSYVKACGSKNVVASLQGLVSEIEKYYYAGISPYDFFRYSSFHDVLKSCLPFQVKKHFQIAGYSEIELLQSINYVFGRTSWDRAHALAINPSLHYFKCNEVLRSEFYTGNWTYSSCVPFSILMSQANTPLKGAHIAIAALPSIVRSYPLARLFIAGGNPTLNQSIPHKLRIRTYGKLLKDLIEKTCMTDYVRFIDYQSAQGMKEALLKSNVFLSASSIENSPNSLGEAQLLGVPCVASYVGGTPDFVPNINSGLLYRYDDREMLSEAICMSFEASSKFDNSEMRKTAMKRHDPKQILSDLLAGYKCIINNN